MKLADLGIRRFSIEVSTTCNIRCTFCPIDQRTVKPQFLPPEKIKPLLDQLAEDGSLECVGFQFLNEPLLHPKIGEMLEYAHAVGLRTLISTNGTVLNDRLINLLARTSPSLLKVSVQDVNPETFKIVKGTKMDIEEFKRRISNLVKRRLTEPVFKSRLELDVAVPVRMGNSWFRRRGMLEKILGVALTDQTINDADDRMVGHLRDFLKHLEKHAGAPIDWDKFLPDLTHTKTWAKDYVPTASLGPGITLELKGFHDWVGIKDHKPITYGSCARLNHVVVNYKGDFQLCCVDTHGKTAIGNLFDEKLSDVLARPDALAKILRAPGYEIPTEHCRICLGASTSRGVAFMNLKNRCRSGHPKFVPESERDASASLERLKKSEHYAGHPKVAEAIEESLGKNRVPQTAR